MYVAVMQIENPVTDQQKEQLMNIDLLKEIGARLEQARRKHPTFARSNGEAGNALDAEVAEFHAERTAEGQHREILDVIVVAYRIANGEIKHAN